MTSALFGKKFMEKNLSYFYFVVFRQQRKLLIFFSTIMLITILATFLLPKTYQSDAKLMVRLGRESVGLDPTASTGQLVGITQSRENEIKTELEILNSRVLAEQVVDSLGYTVFLEREPDRLMASQSIGQIGADNFKGFTKAGFKTVSIVLNGAAKDNESNKERNDVIEKFMKMLNIDFQKNSNIITVSFQSKGQQLSQSVLERLIDFYLERHINVYRTAGSSEFFSRQKEQLRNDLAATEDRLRNLKNRTGYSFIPDQRKALVDRIFNLQKGLEDTESSRAGAKSKLAATEKALAGQPDTLLRMKISGFSTSAIDRLQQSLNDLKVKEQDLLSKYTVKNQNVQEIRRQISEIQALLDKQGASQSQAKKLALLTEQANHAELQAKATSLKGDLVVAQGELKRLNDSEFEITQLEREIEIQKANYRSYADKLEQSRIASALETEKISNISIVQPPYYPISPVFPNKTINLGLGLFMGIFGGLALAFLAESKDHSFKTPEDVNRNIDLPLLSTLPYRDLKECGGDMGRGDSSICPSGKIIWNLSPQVQKDYLPLINHLLMSKEDSKEGRVIALTSCNYGEGVSSIAASLAIGLADLTDRRILLVDANLRQPAINRILEVGQSPGLAELLDRDGLNTTYSQPSPMKNLDILASGFSANPEANLFSASHERTFLDLLRLWKREYHLILIDLPALNEDLSGIRLASLVDGLVFVVEAERTRWEVAQRTIEMLIEAKAKVLGVVLNKRRFHIPDILSRRM